METNNENIVMEENEINTVDPVDEPISGEVVDSTEEFSVSDKHNGAKGKAVGITITAFVAGVIYLVQKSKEKKQSNDEKTESAKKAKKPARRKMKLTWKERVLGYVDLGEESEEEPVTEE